MEDKELKEKVKGIFLDYLPDATLLMGANEALDQITAFIQSERDKAIHALIVTIAKEDPYTAHWVEGFAETLKKPTV